MPKIPVHLEDHYNKEVWTNPVTDKLRRTCCLCMNCERKELWGCDTAKRLYQMCCEENLALMVTRCPYFIEVEDTEHDKGES